MINKKMFLAGALVFGVFSMRAVRILQGEGQVVLCAGNRRNTRDPQWHVAGEKKLMGMKKYHNPSQGLYLHYIGLYKIIAIGKVSAGKEKNNICRMYKSVEKNDD